MISLEIEETMVELSLAALEASAGERMGRHLYRIFLKNDHFFLKHDHFFLKNDHFFLKGLLQSRAFCCEF